jgi:hypothetical protein
MGLNCAQPQVAPPQVQSQQVQYPAPSAVVQQPVVG